MDSQIKAYADQGDLQSLKYIFVDALDVDPTFVRYEEDYNYCKSVPGLLEPYKELTPLVEDPTQWTESYWAHLKLDLQKNFSDRRMQHMREVAKVFWADKIERILAERAKAAEDAKTAAAAGKAPAAPKPQVDVSTTPKPQAAAPSPQPAAAPKPQPVISTSEEEQAAAIKAEKQRIEEEYRKRAAEEQAQKQQLEQARQQMAAQQNTSGTSSKKALGVALVVLAVVALAVILFLVMTRDPHMAL